MSEARKLFGLGRNKLTHSVAGGALIFAAACAWGQGTSPYASTGYNSSTSTSLQAAGRILNQATFGPTTDSLMHVEQVGVAGYVNEQLNAAAYVMPPTATYMGPGD